MVQLGGRQFAGDPGLLAGERLDRPGETALLFLLRWGLDTLRQTMALPQKENAP